MEQAVSGRLATESTLVDHFHSRGLHEADRAAYTFLPEGEHDAVSVSYRELDLGARTLAARLQAAGAAGERALLLYPAGLDYITAFLACLYAGVVAVPAYPPRKNRSLDRIDGIVANAEATFILGTSQIIAGIERQFAAHPHLRNMRSIATDEPAGETPDAWSRPRITGEDLAFLQYTSGSTDRPKGVMVSHQNLMHNQQLMQQAFQLDESDCLLGWLPLYHDMGLIGNVLHSLYTGMHCIFMPPVMFLQKPIRWLDGISRFRPTISGGPNFAYDLCVNKTTPDQREGLDLSSWKIAVNGSEPVRAETISRFSRAFEPYGFDRRSFFPCYGLAEATLFVSGGPRKKAPRTDVVLGSALAEHRIAAASDSTSDSFVLVSSGEAWPGQNIQIVDPETMVPRSNGEVGEIVISGGSVTQGYWKDPVETEHAFAHHVAGSNNGAVLRTGDMGFLSEGELYVTGRIKDILIIRGRNHYPQDIEATVEQSHPALRRGCGAAFSIDVDAEERVAVVFEVKRTAIRTLDVEEIAASIRKAAAEKRDLFVHTIVLLKPGHLPKTTSGKIQRRKCKSDLLNGHLEELGRSPARAMRRPDSGDGLAGETVSQPQPTNGAHASINSRLESSNGRHKLSNGNGGVGNGRHEDANGPGHHDGAQISKNGHRSGVGNGVNSGGSGGLDEHGAAVNRGRAGNPIGDSEIAYTNGFSPLTQSDLLKLAPEKREQRCAGYLQQLLARTRKVAPSTIDTEMPLSSLGLDSLDVAELNVIIESDLELDAPSLEVLHASSITDLARIFVAQLDRHGGASADEAEGDAATVSGQPNDLFDKCALDGGYFGRYRIAGDTYFTQPVLEGPIGPRMRFDGKEVVVWSINNYLGLAGHPHIDDRARQALADHGTWSPMGSRLLTGNTQRHMALEARLAAFLSHEASIVFNFGYMGVLGTINALVDETDTIIIDSLSHACIVDGALLASRGKQFRVFRHNDMESLEDQLKAANARRRGGLLVVTEGLYGMTGDQAPLAEICDLKDAHGARLFIDDAHGFGVMGPTGGGTAEHQGVQDRIDLYFGTFAKTFAGIGGVTAGSKSVIDYIRYNARPNVFAKSLPMVYVEAADAALDLVEQGSDRRTRVWEVATKLQQGLRDLGYKVGESSSPITPVYVPAGDEETAVRAMRLMRSEYGVFVSAVTYPVVPKGVVLFRLTATAAHTDADIEQSLEAFRSLKKQLNLEGATDIASDS